MNVNWLTDKRVGILKSPENPTGSDKTIETLVREGFDSVITIADYDFSISWRVGSKVTLRHYQFALGNYPAPSVWELQHLNEYLLYEIHHDRGAVVWCQNAQTYESVKNSITQFFKYDNAGLDEFVKSKLATQAERAMSIPHELTHCGGCQEKKCITDLVCHVASVTDAETILKSGVILSACKARNKSGQELAIEQRNAAGDPADYFEYVMFTFGNCTAGDRLVMERALGAFPTQEELTRQFSPGVRFYFKYKDLVNHPGFRSDGYHYCKIKDMLELEPFLVVVIAPETASRALLPASSAEVRKRLVFAGTSGYTDLWSWSSRAYQIAREYKKDKLL
jgi:hypothetical protein